MILPERASLAAKRNARVRWRATVATRGYIVDSKQVQTPAGAGIIKTKYANKPSRYQTELAAPPERGHALRVLR